MKFRNPYTFTPPAGEKNGKPSLTIPDQTLTIPEILKRYARGQSLGGSLGEPIYDGDDDIMQGRHPKTLDLTEKQQLEDDVTAELIEIKERTSKKKKPLKQMTIEEPEVQEEFRNDQQETKDAAEN